METFNILMTLKCKNVFEEKKLMKFETNIAKV